MPSFDQYCAYALMNTTLQEVVTENPNYTSIPWTWYANFNLCRITLLIIYVLILCSPFVILVVFCVLFKNYHCLNKKLTRILTLIQEPNNSTI
jgi:hypothetical protein